MFLLLLFVFIISLLLYDVKKRCYDRLPGPKRLPFVGNLLHFVGLSPAETFARLISYSHLYGDVYKLDFLCDYTLVYSSPEAAEKILLSSYFAAKSEDYDKVSEWIGNGLLVSRGHEWMAHRKAIEPAFQARMLKNFVPVFGRHAESFCEKLATLTSERGSGEAINILPELKLLTLGVLCETAMGVEGGEEEEKLRQYTEVVAELTSILYWRMFNWFASFDVLFRLTPSNRRFKALVEQSHTFTHNMIDRRRREVTERRKQSSILPDSESIELRRKAMPLMDKLLEARTEDDKQLTDKEIREEVDTFSFAGYDTTASALTFILYNVSKYPAMQERLYDEIVSEIGTEFGELSAEDLNKLHYMESFIKESLRLFPPVPIVARTATGDTSLLEVPVKRGTSVALSLFAMHRHPRYFRDPEQFNPERFQHGPRAQLDDLRPIGDDRAKFSYIPFSFGPRNCIGKQFAMLEIKITLVKVLQSFQLKLINPLYEPRLKAEIVLTSADGMPLIFRRRK